MENSLKQKVENRILDLLVLASNLGLTDIEVPEIKFDIKGRDAGQCTYYPQREVCVLRFNLGFLNKYEEDFLKQTVAHEVAHYIVSILYDRTKTRPHGKEWQMIMRVFGIENPKRCHNYCNIGSSRSPWLYRCKCQDHFLGIRRHNCARSGIHYRCSKCKGLLRFVKKVTI